jgi:hypothetical protein
MKTQIRLFRTSGRQSAPETVPDRTEIRRTATEVRQLWSPAERRQRLRRGQQKRAELLALMLASQDFFRCDR